ncbi:MAG: SMEK domain-containing protein [bacterium]|nr:SMEK domain-containing protein [bacterium]
MGSQEEIERISELLARWLARVRILNKMGLFHINIHAENIAVKLLNEIYDYNLENLNKEKSNFAGIDLGDKVTKIAFQVTSRKDVKKIKDNLKTFAEGDLKNIYSNGIRFLILNQDKPGKSNAYQKIYPAFDQEAHFLNDGDLAREVMEIQQRDEEKFLRIKHILEKEFGDSGRPPAPKGAKLRSFARYMCNREKLETYFEVFFDFYAKNDRKRPL